MYIILSNNSDVPIYRQIADGVRNNIISGELSAGDALPSIRSLARELGVSVITTKHAYELLEQQGYITTTPQRGSVVSARSASLAAEHRRAALEQQLLSAIDTAKELNIGEDEFIEIARELFKEDL